MKGMVILGTAAAAAALLAITAGAARADPAHSTFSFSGQQLNPAGTACDFNEQETFAINGFVNGPAGSPLGSVVLTESFTHTNLDTGYSLSEVDHVTAVTQVVRGTVTNVGIFFHLRDASGTNVLVKAGELTFDATTGEFISFTPNSGWDQTAGQILCPLLGGSPA
ncbi:MAG: hypothetical protein ACTHNB_12905 [Gaiellaceae bacterium]